MNNEEPKKQEIKTNQSDKTQNDTPENNKEFFVVPESDGIKSGYPIIDDENIDPNEQDQQFKNLLRAGYKQKTPLKNQKNQLLPAVSIKFKLLSSFIFFIFIVFILGITSLIFSYDINKVTLNVSKLYPIFAKLSDDIKANIFSIRDAEKDFLTSQAQIDTDKINRFIERSRIRIKEALDLAKQTDPIDSSTGIKQFEKLSESLDNYESFFNQFIKDIAQSRQDTDKSLSEMKEDKDKLLSELGKLRDSIKSICDNYWIKMQHIEVKNNNTAIKTGSILNRLEKQIYILFFQIARFLESEKQSYADFAKDDIEEALRLTDQIRNEANDEEISLQINDIRKSLSNYRSTFLETIDTLSDISKLNESFLKKSAAQKQGLQSKGETLLDISNRIAQENWERINSESSNLLAISQKAGLFISIVFVVGFSIGVLILVYVPRPILKSISEIVLSVKLLSEGNLKASVSILKNDELGQLALSFETMRLNFVSLIERIQRAGIQISTAVNEIQASSNEQTNTSNEQANAINEFTTTLTEISRTSSHLAGITDKVFQNTKQISSWVNETNNKSEELIESMNSINGSTKQTSDRIKSLNDQMDTINDAVTTISGVSDQTTLLSLNAAIEANKAGEMGKGFSVVSAEIRRLSDRSIDAAMSITNIVRAIQRATENSVVAMDKASEEIRIGIERVRQSTETLEGINKSMLQIQEQVSQIATSTKEQADSSVQTQQTASELLSSSRMVAQAARQISIASYELSSMANELNSAAAEFKI